MSKQTISNFWLRYTFVLNKSIRVGGKRIEAVALGVSSSISLMTLHRLISVLGRCVFKHSSPLRLCCYPAIDGGWLAVIIFSGWMFSIPIHNLSIPITGFVEEPTPPSILLPSGTRPESVHWTNFERCFYHCCYYVKFAELTSHPIYALPPLLCVLFVLLHHFHCRLTFLLLIRSKP